jgi:hypothetical protein
MYILNTSFMVDYDVHDHWLGAFRNHFLPFLRQEGFGEPLFTRVVSNDAEGHFTYSLQLSLPDLSRYKEYTEVILADYAATVTPVYGEKVLWFVSLLKKVE